MELEMKKKMLELIFVTLLITIIFGIDASAQITSNQSDNFEDGTVQGWSEGNPSPNPPANIADGGPGGTGDNYLQNVSSGGGGAGSRLAMFNTDQWKGDYTSAGVTDISMHMNNLGATNLEMRLAFDGNGGRCSSTNSVSLSAGSGWQTVVFPIGPSDLTLVDGGTNVNATLSNVTELRILHNTSPNWKGASIAATLGVDNITASDMPVHVEQTVVNVPQTSQLEQNYPNPFNPSTNIQYSISESSKIKLTIYNLIGEEVALLVNGIVEVGFYEVTFNATKLPGGIYFYRLQANGYTQTKKMILMK
jgi:hypothetical protein